VVPWVGGHILHLATPLLFQAVDINEKVFGENSDRAADSLRVAADLLVFEKKFAKAEPYLLRAVHVDEGVYGRDSIDLAAPLTSLCNLYNKWDKPTQSEACYEHLLTVLEEQYGRDNPVIVSVLLSDAKALREVGRAAGGEGGPARGVNPGRHHETQLRGRKRTSQVYP
jgi:eukaryotic-like serine/threonine-protein kinase